MQRRILRTLTLALLLALLVSLAHAADETVYIQPQIPTEAEKIMALKLAYELNGRSMVGWGRMIDLSGPPDLRDATPIGPPAPPLRKGDRR